MTQRGFSLIESSIAMGVLLVVSLSILPMFTRSMAIANSGREKTDAATFLHLADELLTMPVGEGAMAPPGGEKTREELAYWCEGDQHVAADPDEGWSSDPDGRGQVLWKRLTRLRQYSVSALDADAAGRSDLQEAEAVVGGETPESVHLTITEVLLDGRRGGGPLGPSVLTTARQIRAF
jgi:prepilin-type N-terminal cleavage/methylation domain-containing protein